MSVVAFDEVVDLGHQFFDTGERTAANGLLRDEAKPTLDLVQPRGVGRGVMDVVAWPFGEPRLDLGVLVGGVVVDDEMDIERGGHVAVHVP